MDNNFSVTLKSGRFNIYNKDNGNSYTVLIHDDEVQCDCKSYEFCIEPKSCKHIRFIEDKLDELIPNVEVQQY